MDEKFKNHAAFKAEVLEKFLSEMETGWKLDLSSLSLHDGDMERLPPFLENWKPSKALTVDLSCNFISDQGLKKLVQFLESGKASHLEELKINLTRNQKIHDNSVESVINLLNNENCPKKITFVFMMGTSITLAGAKDLECCLLGNTNACITLRLGPPPLDIARLGVLNERNQLIWKYPDFETYIKKVCSEKGLYRMSAFEIKSLSLKFLSAFCLMANPHITHQNIPTDLNQYIQKIQEVKQELEKINIDEEEANRPFSNKILF